MLSDRPATAGRTTFHFPPDMAGLEVGAALLARMLDAHALPPSPRYHVELAFDEVAGNIVRHGAPTADIEVAVDIADTEITLMFTDDGVSFDPRGHIDPPPPTSLDDARAGQGGLGLPLVRRISSSMEYERTSHGCNRLTVTIPVR